jgi:hypothetical protein
VTLRCVVTLIKLTNITLLGERGVTEMVTWVNQRFFSQQCLRLQLQIRITSGSTWLVFGINMSLLKFQYSRGAFSAIVFQQKRGIIKAEANVCVSGCEVQELADHLFITCRHLGQLWMQIHSWFGISSVDTSSAQGHFHPFGHLGGFPRQTHPFLNLIWFSCTWMI